MLFYPLEEQFDLPAHAIELGDGERREREVVREEDKSLGGLGIVELDSAQLSFVTLVRVEARKHHGLIANQTSGPIDRVRVATLDFQVRFGAGDEEAARLVESGQALEVDIGPIHYVEGTGLRRELVQNLDIVKLAIADEDERGNVATQIEQGVHFHRRLGRSKRCPGKRREAQIYGGRIECVDGLLQVQSERLLGIKLSSNSNQALS